MKKRKIHIDEKQLVGLLEESEWNFHFGKDHDLTICGSDNKYQMAGRETGHLVVVHIFQPIRVKIDSLNGQKKSKPKLHRNCQSLI